MENKRHSVLIRCIAVFCSLVMVFSSVPTFAYAEELTEPEYVAAIGENLYETLQEAVDAADGEAVITLTEDTEGDGITVAADKDIIFDFGGYTYTVTGELVGSSGTKTLGMQILKGAKVTLRNGTFKADKHVKMLVQNYSDLTLDSFSLDVTGVDYEYAYALSNNSGEILITGESNISSDFCAFDLWYGFMGAYLDGVSVTFDENYTGTVTGAIEYGKDSRADVSDWLDKTALVIKNGTFNGNFVATSGELKDANIVITGGKFTDSNAALFCEDGYKLDNDGQVVERYIASIGDSVYKTLQEAVDAAEDGAVITILADGDGNGVTIGADKDVTFDFAGHTYTVTGELVGSSGTKTLGMQILEGAKVTLRNGTFKADKHVKMLVQNYSDLTLDNFSLDVTGVDYEYAYALSNNNGNILITGESNISSDYCAFDLWYGFMGAYLDGVSVTFDENYTGTVTGAIEYGKDSRADASDWLDKTALVIKNGTFNGNLVFTSEFDTAEANITVYGGTFTDKAFGAYCADDYKMNDDGQVVEKNYIAVSGDSKFETLQEAVDAADGETVITLLKDVEGDGVVVAADKDIIFDFDGHTYTVTGELVGSTGTKTLGMQILEGAKVTLRNGTFKADKHVKMLVQNYSDLTLDNFSLDVTGVDYEYAYALSNNNGNILITGESNISSDFCAFDLWYGFMGAYLDGVSVTFDENYTGTVTGAIEYGKDSRADISDWLGKTALVIKNGTFNGNFVATSGELKDANIVITGGKFTDSNAALFCEDGYKLDNEGQVVERYIASIGDSVYKTLQEAVDAAEDGAVITILADGNGNGVTIGADKNITFDFDGHTYTVTGKLVGSTGTKTLGMQILEGAKVTLRNGTFKADKHVKMLVQNYSDLTLDSFNLDVTGVDYEYAYALSNNNGNILITGESNISSDYCAFDLWYGFMGAYLDGVSVTFDENYTGTVTGAIEYGKDSRADVSDWLGKTALVIKNGTFNGNLVFTSDFDTAEANITVYGGTFTDKAFGAYCADDYKMNEDGQIVEKYIAVSGDSKFETLQEAVDAAEGETVITLLRTVDGDGVVVAADKDIIFDFDGHTYTVAGELVGSSGTKTLGMQILEGAKVTLRNGTFKADKHVKMLVQNYSDLTLDSFSLDVTGVDYEYAYALSNNNGNILITGESNISSDYCAFDLWYGFMGAYLDGVSVTFDENYTGTVTGAIEYGKDSRADVSDWLNKTALVIKNGTFDGEIILTTEFYPDDANITVSGGKFIGELEDGWCAEGYSKAIFDDGYYGVCIHEFTQQIKDEAHLLSKADCVTGSVYYFDCAYCVKTGRATYTDSDAAGHSFTKYIYSNDATCTQDGTATATCDREGCSAKDTKTVADTALGHKLGDWVVIENATCIKTGIKERACIRCSLKETEEITAGHNFSNIITTDKAATCTENGSESKHCIVCGEKNDVNVIPATGHKNGTTVTPASTEKDGAIVTVCSVCKLSSTEKISKIASVTIENKKYNYTGSDITPPVTVKDSSGKILKEGTDFTVAYKNNKAAGKADVTVTFKGNYAGSETLTFTIVSKSVSAVTGLKAEMEKNSIAVTFNAVKGATGYEISVYNEQTKKYDLISTVRKTRYVLKRIKGKKFTAGTTYKIRVVAIIGSGSEKIASKARTATVTTPLQQGVLVSAASSKAKIMQIKWNTFENTNGYEIVYSTSKKFTKKTTKTKLIKKASTAKTTIKNLKSGKKYFVKIRAFKTVEGKKIYGGYSKIKTVKAK